MRGDLFLRAAMLALDEVGDPTNVRRLIENAPQPVRALPRPTSTVKRVAWNATRLAMFADDAARAYAQLHELCNTLFGPLAGRRRPAAPAPEVALTLSPAALLDALAPPPRVMVREVAVAAKLDSTFLLDDPRPERRVLGVRSISAHKLARFAVRLAEVLARDPDPVVRAEVTAIVGGASEAVRETIAAALALHTEDTAGAVRASALDGLRALKLPLADPRLVARLGDDDPAVRAAAARSVISTSVVGDALVARLADDDPDVRTAALDAVVRNTKLHRAALVAPLRALLARHEGDTRAAIYLLGKLHGQAPVREIMPQAPFPGHSPSVREIMPQAPFPGHSPSVREIMPQAPFPGHAEEVVQALRECLGGTRSDVAHAAGLVLAQLGAEAPPVPVETRLLRAARELAAPDRDTQLAGLFEATRLADAARPLIPALRRLGELLAAVDDPASRATFAQVCDALQTLGVPAAELPRPRKLDAWRGIAPRERAVHGAYAIAAIEIPATNTAPAASALGLWDHATGAVLFVVEHAELLELIPGRAEVGVVRVADEDWFFERYRVPSGERLASLAIPEALAHGWPSALAVAGGLATVWCGHEDEPYRFHIKLDDPDRLLDDEPNVARNAKRGSTKLPRSKATRTK